MGGFVEARSGPSSVSSPQLSNARTEPEASHALCLRLRLPLIGVLRFGLAQLVERRNAEALEQLFDHANDRIVAARPSIAGHRGCRRGDQTERENEDENGCGKLW